MKSVYSSICGYNLEWNLREPKRGSSSNLTLEDDLIQGVRMNSLKDQIVLWYMVTRNKAEKKNSPLMNPCDKALKPYLLAKGCKFVLSA